MGKDSLDGRFIGEIGMAMAVEQLLRAGFHVAMPVIDDGYDILAFDGRRHWRIQVKATASTARNRVRITRGGDKLKRYSAKHVDAFVAVHIGTGTVLCVPVSEARGVWLSFLNKERYKDFRVLKTITS